MTEEPQVIYCVIASSRTFKRPAYTHNLVSLHTDLYFAWQKIEQLYNSMLPTLNEVSSIVMRVYPNGFEVIYYDFIFNDRMSKDFFIETRPVE